MIARLLALSLLTATLLLPAAKKTVATAKGENEDVILTVTLHLDPADVKEMIGSDLGGHYIVGEVKVEPKYGKTVIVDRADFLLRTDKDGEKAQPFAPSQIAGQGALVVSQRSDNTGIGSPGWSGATSTVIIGGAARNPQTEGDAKDAKPVMKNDEKPNPLKKVLDDKVLAEKKIDKPESGLLYFPLEKQKMKDLQLEYGGRENRITLRFKTEPRP